MKTGSSNLKQTTTCESLCRPASGSLRPSLTPWKANFMSLTKSAIGAAVLTAAMSFNAKAASPPAGVAPVTVPAGGFRIVGELVAGSSGAGDWLAGPGTAGVLDATGAPLNPNTT